MIINQLEISEDEVRCVLAYAMLPEMPSSHARRLIAERLNAVIEEKVHCCPKVYGIVFSDGTVGARWSRSPFTSTNGRSTHLAYLIEFKKHRSCDGEL